MLNLGSFDLESGEVNPKKLPKMEKNEIESLINERARARSSILDSWSLDQGLIKILSFIWILPFAAFIAVSWGLWTGANWWSNVAWGGTAVSVIYFILYWNSFPSNVPIQANLGNIVALAGLLGIIKIA